MKYRTCPSFNTKQRGVTPLNIIITVVVVAIIAALMVLAFINFTDKNKMSKAVDGLTTTAASIKVNYENNPQFAAFTTKIAVEGKMVAAAFVNEDVSAGTFKVTNPFTTEAKTPSASPAAPSATAPFSAGPAVKVDASYGNGFYVALGYLDQSECIGVAQFFVNSTSTNHLTYVGSTKVTDVSGVDTACKGKDTADNKVVAIVFPM